MALKKKNDTILEQNEAIEEQESEESFIVLDSGSSGGTSNFISKSKTAKVEEVKVRDQTDSLSSQEDADDSSSSESLDPEKLIPIKKERL